ncbi:MAG: hypothetical protein O7E57_05475 [Gammaproteobacteria bacterium]|nr:hypothetical protein [Gammaproteobacteria bacterium]
MKHRGQFKGWVSAVTHGPFSPVAETFTTEVPLADLNRDGRGT